MTDLPGTIQPPLQSLPDWAEQLTQDASFLARAQGVFETGLSERGLFQLSEPKVTRQLDLTLAPIGGPAGTVTGVSVCVIDVTRHQQIQAANADRAECYRLAADYTYDWEYWIAPEGRLRWMSPSSERVTGRDATAFFLDPGLLEAILHPEDRPLAGAYLHQGNRDGSPNCLNFRILRPDGEVRWIEQICQTIYEADGELVGTRASNRDVTDRMLMEQALRESETQFRLMFELATVGMALVDPESRRLVRVNQRLCRLLGYEADELLETTFYLLTHPEDRDKDLVSYRRAMRKEDSDYFTEKRYIRKDGQIVWALVNAAFIRDADGRPLKAVAAIIDITDRRRAEARARELAAVVECSSDFIGIAGLDERCLYLNQAGQALVGLDGDEEVQSIKVEELVFPEDLPFARNVVLPAILASGRWAGEFRFRHFRTGEPIAVYWDALRIDDPETGRPLRLATVTRDIRREKAAEEALLQADRRKDEFLAMLGHELRNPMAPIRNAVEIIRHVGIGEDPRTAWAIEVLDRQTAHMSRLLDDLLDVSRIVRGCLDLERSAVQVSDIVQQAVDGVQSLMQQRRHHFTWDLPTPDILVEGDPVRLSQVLLNLLVNAAKYTPEGGNVRIETAIGQGEVLIRVRDNGQGMAPEQIGSLFSIFSPGVRPPDTPSGGLGLGLAIARRLTEMHGGRLEVFSDGIGLGTEVQLHLPLAKQAPAEQAPVAGATAPMPGRQGLRILVVDDNADVAGALALLLQVLGYEVRTAASGEEAITIVREFRPRIAFLDIGMPTMDGLELAGRLRAEHPRHEELMLAALTGLGHEEARERSMAAGFDAHLVKPLEQKVLLALLEQLR